jgi:flagellar basal body rod protein FlgG
MDISLYQAAAAMNAGSRWQEIIADNLAASQIPGFKKQDMAFSDVQSGFMADSTKAMPGTAPRFVMPLAGSSTNFQAGELRPTGCKTDFGIEGAGFFAVQMPDGSTGYTRDGEFHINAQGQLVSKQGLAVLGDSGPVQLNLNNPGSLEVAPSGDITQNGVTMGRVKIVQFSNPSALQGTGTGLFIATDPSLQPQAPTHSTVRQGFLECANTSPVMEMGNLITAMRFYEANTKVVQSEDNRLGQLISQVANPS